MPYISALLDSHTSAAVAAAAADMAAHSPFKPEERPLHVTLIGTLHMYSDDQIASALSKVVPPGATMPSGRFTRWEITRRSLRICVESPSMGPVARLLHKNLPKGRVWKPQHVTVGSIEGIPAAQHAEFLAAVEAAFPIVENSVFTVPCLEFENDVEDRTNPPAVWFGGSMAPQVLNRASGGHVPRSERPQTIGHSTQRTPMDVELQRPKCHIRKKPMPKFKPVAGALAQPLPAPRQPDHKAKGKAQSRVVNVVRHW